MKRLLCHLLVKTEFQQEGSALHRASSVGRMPIIMLDAGIHLWEFNSLVMLFQNNATLDFVLQLLLRLAFVLLSTWLMISFRNLKSCLLRIFSGHKSILRWYPLKQQKDLQV